MIEDSFIMPDVLFGLISAFTINYIQNFRCSGLKMRLICDVMRRMRL